MFSGALEKYARVGQIVLYSLDKLSNNASIKSPDGAAMLATLTEHPFLFAASALAFALSVEAGATLLRRRALRKRIERRVADIAKEG